MIYNREAEEREYDRILAEAHTVSDRFGLTPRITGFRIESWRCTFWLPTGPIPIGIGRAGHGRHLIGLGESARDAYIDMLGRMGAV